MRKRNYVVGALLLAAAMAVPGTASADLLGQTMKGAVTPTTLSTDSKAPTPVSLRIDADAQYSAPDSAGPYATEDLIDFDNDLTINAKGLPTCDPTQLESTTTEVALQLCGPAQVGSGTALVDGSIGPKDAVVTAFNGIPQGGQPVILLHTRLTTAPITQVLVGVIEPSPLGGDFGQRLDVSVPPLAGGTEVITHFDTTVQKTFTVKKKVKGKLKKVKMSYVSATCRDKDHLLNFQGIFNFSGPPSPLNASASQPCVPKKAKKKK